MITTKWFEGEQGIEDALYIRTVVFIEEQRVSVEEEMNGTDENAVHLVVYENEVAVATGRIIIENDCFILGRIAVLKEHRGKKLGDLVVRMLIRKAYTMGGRKQYIHAQIYAKGFYEKLGFEAYGDEYMEVNIPHLSMVHTGDIGGHCGK